MTDSTPGADTLCGTPDNAKPTDNDGPLASEALQRIHDRLGRSHE